MMAIKRNKIAGNIATMYIQRKKIALEKVHAKRNRMLWLENCFRKNGFSSVVESQEHLLVSCDQ